MVDETRGLALSVGEIRLLPARTPESAPTPPLPLSAYIYITIYSTYLRVPEVRPDVVGLVSELEGDYLVHRRAQGMLGGRSGAPRMSMFCVRRYPIPSVICYGPMHSAQPVDGAWLGPACMFIIGHSYL